MRGYKLGFFVFLPWKSIKIVDDFCFTHLQHTLRKDFLCHTQWSSARKVSAKKKAGRLNILNFTQSQSLRFCVNSSTKTSAGCPKKDKRKTWLQHWHMKITDQATKKKSVASWRRKSYFAHSRVNVMKFKMIGFRWSCDRVSCLYEYMRQPVINVYVNNLRLNAFILIQRHTIILKYYFFIS